MKKKKRERSRVASEEGGSEKKAIGYVHCQRTVQKEKKIEKEKETKHVKCESIERKTEFFHLAVEKVKHIPTRAMINY